MLCQHNVWRFMPHQFGPDGSPKLMDVLGGIGSDTENFECPRCGCNDRERHLLLYLRATSLLTAMHGQAILHFAPEKRLSKLIAATEPERYVRCDLYPRTPDIERADMLDIPFEDRSFDVVIANHVLEHVADDLKALTEIHRVLKRGGYAILQTPYSSKLHNTWQDAGIDTPTARLQAYGQGDHVRLFGRDIFERFASAGLAPHVVSHDAILADTDPARFGVNPNEPFFLFQRID